MSVTVIPLYDKLYPAWMTRQIPEEKTTGLEPHPCIVYPVEFTFSVCHGNLCVERLTVLSLLRPDVAPAFFLSSRPALPCPPASCPWISPCS